LEQSFWMSVQLDGVDTLKISEPQPKLNFLFQTQAS
jgi:hypothetical protein